MPTPNTFAQAARHAILRAAKDTVNGGVRPGVYRETIEFWPNGIAYKLTVQEYTPTPKERVQMILEKSRMDPDIAEGLRRLVDYVDDSVLEEAMVPKDQRRLVE